MKREEKTTFSGWIDILPRKERRINPTFKLTFFNPSDLDELIHHRHFILFFLTLDQFIFFFLTLDKFIPNKRCLRFNKYFVTILHRKVKENLGLDI